MILHRQTYDLQTCFDVKQTLQWKATFNSVASSEFQSDITTRQRKFTTLSDHRLTVGNNTIATDLKFWMILSHLVGWLKQLKLTKWNVRD